MTKYLIELHERKLLVMLEEPKSKKIGDKPIEYRLCLPEGLDKKVIDTRRGKYYAGKPYISRYNESFVEIPAVGDRISDISAQIVMRHQSAKIADSSAKFADRSSKIADQSAEIAPINKENNASLSEYNNNEPVVVDEEVGKFLEEAASPIRLSGASTPMKVTSICASISRTSSFAIVDTLSPPPKTSYLA